MEPALTGSVDKLLERGLSGIVMLALAFMCWHLWKKLNEIQEKRIEESRETVKALEESSSVLENIVRVFEATRRDK